MICSIFLLIVLRFGRSYLDTISFVSGSNASIQHPLIYKHPIRQDDTIMLALGTLSGQYLKTSPDGRTTILSKEETQLIQGMQCGINKYSNSH